MVLTLADFDTAGLDVLLSALITAGNNAQAGGTAIYVSGVGTPGGWGTHGTLDDGSLEYVSGSSISRILYVTGSSTMRFNDNPDPALIYDFFDSGDGAGTTCYLQTEADGVTSFDIDDGIYRVDGSNWINLLPGAAFFTMLTGIGAGDAFIMAIASVSGVELEADGDAAVTTGSVSLTVTNPAAVALEADGDASVSTGEASLTVAPLVALEADGRAAVTTGEVSLTVVIPVALLADGDAAAATGSVSLTVTNPAAVALEADGSATVSTGAASLTVKRLILLEADGDAAVSTGAASLRVTLPGAVALEASGSVSVTTGTGTLTIRNVRHRIGEHGRFGMTLAYCTLAAAQPLAADGRSGRMSVRMRQILAASHRISELRGSPLYAVRTETFDAFGYSAGTTNWWALPVDIARLLSVTASGESVALPDAALRWRQIGIPSRYGPPLVIEAEWGPGWRGTAVAGSAIAQTAQALTTPSPEPDWWEEGAVMLVEKEVMLLGEEDSTTRKVTRTNPVAHVAGDWIPIFSPDALQTACAAMARRLNWQEANPSRKAEWARLEQDYAGLIRDGV